MASWGAASSAPTNSNSNAAARLRPFCMRAWHAVPLPTRKQFNGRDARPKKNRRPPQSQNQIPRLRAGGTPALRVQRQLQRRAQQAAPLPIRKHFNGNCNGWRSAAKRDGAGEEMRREILHLRSRVQNDEGWASPCGLLLLLCRRLVRLCRPIVLLRLLGFRRLVGGGGCAGGGLHLLGA